MVSYPIIEKNQEKVRFVNLKKDEWGPVIVGVVKGELTDLT